MSLAAARTHLPTALEAEANERDLVRAHRDTKAHSAPPIFTKWRERAPSDRGHDGLFSAEPGAWYPDAMGNGGDEREDVERRFDAWARRKKPSTAGGRVLATIAIAGIAAVLGYYAGARTSAETQSGSSGTRSAADAGSVSQFYCENVPFSWNATRMCFAKPSSSPQCERDAGGCFTQRRAWCYTRSVHNGQFSYSSTKHMAVCMPTAKECRDDHQTAEHNWSGPPPVLTGCKEAEVEDARPDDVSEGPPPPAPSKPRSPPPPSATSFFCARTPPRLCELTATACTRRTGGCFERPRAWCSIFFSFGDTLGTASVCLPDADECRRMQANFAASGGRVDLECRQVAPDEAIPATQERHLTTE